MWFQYVFDRVAGEDLFQAALDGDTSVRESEESREALGKLRELIDAGAFGTNFHSVKFTDGGSPTLLSSGRAGFELTGSWAYPTHLASWHQRTPRAQVPRRAGATTSWPRSGI
jgi:xylobiose transport system substrate-binding protein